jgi:integrase
MKLCISPGWYLRAFVPQYCVDSAPYLIETGPRKNVIRTLQWKWINLTNACIQFGKDKTPSGTGRSIPLNRRALETVKLWAHRFPNREPGHYVFPAERYGASGDVFEATAYGTDPTKPVASIKEAWEGAKERAWLKCGSMI